MVRAWTKNYSQSLVTIMLGLIIIFIYSILGFQYFNNDFIVNNENLCETLFECWIWTIQYGLRNGGGIADSLEVVSYSFENRIHYYFRFLYDTSFAIIISIILLNVLFGVIIDTFAELRDKRNRMLDDWNN